MNFADLSIDTMLQMVDAEISQLPSLDAAAAQVTAMKTEVVNAEDSLDKATGGLVQDALDKASGGTKNGRGGVRQNAPWNDKAGAAFARRARASVESMAPWRDPKLDIVFDDLRSSLSQTRQLLAELKQQAEQQQQLLNTAPTFPPGATMNAAAELRALQAQGAQQMDNLAKVFDDKAAEVAKATPTVAWRGPTGTDGTAAANPTAKTQAGMNQPGTPGGAGRGGTGAGSPNVRAADPMSSAPGDANGATGEAAGANGVPGASGAGDASGAGSTGAAAGASGTGSGTGTGSNPGDQGDGTGLSSLPSAPPRATPVLPSLPPQIPSVITPVTHTPGLPMTPLPPPGLPLSRNSRLPSISGGKPSGLPHVGGIDGTGVGRGLNQSDPAGPPAQAARQMSGRSSLATPEAGPVQPGRLPAVNPAGATGAGGMPPPMMPPMAPGQSGGVPKPGTAERPAQGGRRRRTDGLPGVPAGLRGRSGKSAESARFAPVSAVSRRRQADNEVSTVQLLDEELWDIDQASGSEAPANRRRIRPPSSA